MRQFLIDYALNVIIAGILLALASFLYGQARDFYYAHADLTRFYESVSFTVEDICVGQIDQNVQSVRFVHGTVIGYRAIVIRELGQIEDDTFVKIHEERVEPFIEYIPDGIAYRVQKLPFELSEGSYQWVLYPTIFIEGVKRTDAPPIESNVFQVTNC